jgi:hypothetical protein
MANNPRTFTPVFVALLFSGLSGYAASPNDDRVEQLLREAKGFFGTGRYDLALPRCEEAIKLDPSNRVARAQLEKIKRESAALKNPEKAEAKVIRPTYPPQHLRRLPGSPIFK